MSTVKSKKLQVGTDATSSNNFTIYQPATPDGTLRIGVGNADSPTEVGRFTSAGYKPATAPLFMAYANAGQSLSNATWTKIQINTEEYDTNSNYNTSNYRFTPTVAGYYQVNAGITFTYTSAADKSFASAIYKNGSPVKYTGRDSSTGLVFPVPTASVLIYMNGSTDFIELYAYQNTGGSASTSGAIADTYFSAHLVQQA